MTATLPPPQPGQPPTSSIGKDDLVRGPAPSRTSRWSPMWAVVAAVLVVTAGAGGLVAFAEDADSPTARHPIASAVEQAVEADTLSFDLTMSAGSFGTVSTSGAVDEAAELMAASIDVSSVGGSSDAGSGGLGDVLGDVLGGAVGPVELIVDGGGGRLYASTQGLGRLPIDADWISVDLAALAEKAGTSFDDVQSQLSFDPTESVVALLDESDPVEVGLEEIDGAPVTHYEVPVDVAQVLAANAPVQQQLDRWGVDVAGSLPDDVHVDVWIGAGGELRRVAFEIPIHEEALRVQLDLRAIGEALDLEVPADDDVVDVSWLMGS